MYGDFQDKLQRIAAIAGFVLALFLIFSFLMASQTEIPFFQNVVDGILRCFTNFFGYIVVGLLIIIALIVFAPALLIGLFILAVIAIIAIVGLFIAAIAV